MGLLDDLTKQVLGDTGGAAGHADMIGAAMSLLNQHGGIAGLTQLFEQNGLGHMMSSWVSTGPNPPISPSQVQNVFGPGKIGDLAKSMGITPQVAATTLAAVLPSLIDRLTPNGTPHGSLLDSGLDILKKSGLFGS